MKKPKPRPKKRTAGVEVVKVDGYADRVDVDADETMIGFYQYKNANPESFYPATLTVHIPKRRSSK